MIKLLLPLAGSVLLASFIALPRIISNGYLVGAFAGRLLDLPVWLIALVQRRTRFALTISLRPQHYLQAFAQRRSSCIGATTGRSIHDAAPLIAAQLLFAYGFDSLLSWTHRRTFALGFGPFPIIFSITCSSGSRTTGSTCSS